jgi:hypothetical protein
LTKGERKAAEAIYGDLKDAFGKTNPEQFIGPGKNVPPPSSQ